MLREIFEIASAFAEFEYSTRQPACRQAGIQYSANNMSMLKEMFNVNFKDQRQYSNLKVAVDVES